MSSSESLMEILLETQKTVDSNTICRVTTASTASTRPCAVTFVRCQRLWLDDVSKLKLQWRRKIIAMEVWKLFSAHHRSWVKQIYQNRTLNSDTGCTKQSPSWMASLSPVHLELDKKGFWLHKINRYMTLSSINHACPSHPTLISSRLLKVTGQDRKRFFLSQ